MPKLTKRYIESIKPASDKPLKIWDSELKGFGIVVLPSGRKTYCIQYRNQERTLKRLKIGVHGTLSTEEARELAKKKLSSLAHGKDPALEKKMLQKFISISQLADEYIERHGSNKRPKSLYEDNNLLKNIILPCLGSQSISMLTRRDIESFQKRFENTPYQANRALSLLSKMFALAMAWGWRADNPVKGIQKYQEEKRDRWLNKDELDRLWNVLENYPQHISTHLFKFLLLTGARKGEVMNATWDQFDLKKGVWTKPSHLTKQKKKEHLPLSAKAVEVLHSIRDLTQKKSSFVFPGRVEGEPIKEVKKFWKKVVKEANIENVRIHDLRHTHASHLVSSGLSLSIVGKLLGHTQASTTQRYAHLADEPLREAAELFGSKVGQ